MALKTIRTLTWGVFALTFALPATTLPAGLAESQYVGGLTRPVQMAFAPDGRLFVCEQDGALRIVKNGVLLAEPFMKLDVRSDVERGLISVAFDPDFATNQYIYVFYSALVSPAANRVSRFTANGDFVAPGSERILLEVDGRRNPNHNGGALHFGPDGKLYIALGENTRAAEAQNRSNLLGKLLRMNKDGSVPSDNPFAADPAVSGINKLIWSYGLRNPYTFAIDGANGRVFIADVGADLWEEINVGAPGANFGWPLVEGPAPPGTTPDPALTYPAYAYPHTGTPRPCAIIGGSVYRPTARALPDRYVGKYFFGDVCGRWIRVFNPDDNSVEDFATGTPDLSDMDTGPDGALYYVSRRESAGAGAGRIYRIAAAGDSPAITVEPADQTVTAGQSVTFTVAASGSAPLRYQWQRNGVAIAGATSASYVISRVPLEDNGAVFRAVVTNDAGSATSRGAVLSVTANRAPVATIVTPAASFLYTAGTTLSYSGTGSDAEDGELPASAFTWMILFHHDEHTHPFLPATPGAKSGSIRLPNDDHTEHSVWFRIYLTVRDSGGLTHTTFRDVFPRKNSIALNTAPAGLQITWDGPPVTAPYTTLSVVGIIHTIGAPATQTKGGISYRFIGWMHGGAATQAITATTANQTFTALYQATASSVLPEPTFVYRDTGNVVRLHRYGATAPALTGGVLAGNPASVQDAAGDTWIASRSFNSLYLNRYSAATGLFSGWTFLGGISAGDPAIQVNAAGEAWMAIRDPANAYYLTSYSASAGQGPFVFLGGLLASDPSLALAPDGTLYVAGRDHFGGLWTAVYNTVAHTFTGWTFLGGLTQGKPSARVGADGALYVAARDLYNGVWMCRYAGGAPFWSSARGIAGNDPQLVASGPGTLYVGILDQFNALYYRGFAEGAGHNWLPWASPGGILQGIAPAGGGGELWVAGTHPNGLYWWRMTGSQWNYIGPGALVDSAPSAAPH